VLLFESIVPGASGVALDKKPADSVGMQGDRAHRRNGQVAAWCCPSSRTGSLRKRYVLVVPSRTVATRKSSTGEPFSLCSGAARETPCGALS
jgi:hypothetical protein